VESFIVTLERHGPVFVHGDDADFEAEPPLASVRQMADPTRCSEKIKAPHESISDRSRGAFKFGPLT
jgi:hypothetical protein